MRFRTDAFHVGTVDGVEGTTLFSYWPSGGGEGGLIGIWLDGDLIRREKVKDLLFRSEEYSTLFFEGKGEIVKAKVEDLATEAQRMALIGGPPPESTGRFVSRPAEAPNKGQEESPLSSLEAASVADVPAIQATSDEESDESTASAEAARTEEPEGSGWSGGMLVVSIAAVAFLLALASYRVFSKKGRSEQ